ncbi:plasmid replication protein RepC [Limoniibacter endophyticus]|uniref:plasmid replication protein RepC n=1 Tax=Limoniibacter endophyticus TaxID=1565040 RepID=UPI00167B375F|nr:plasmid replication protein RepC [Limoniibacter endophyticus]
MRVHTPFLPIHFPRTEGSSFIAKANGIFMRKFPTLASFRKPSAAILESSRLAASFDLPDTTKAEASITLKRAAPCLGIDGTVYHVLDILIGLTRPQDWQGTNRPIVAISNERLADYTMRSERTVIRCLRKLVEAGILAYRDSATGRRFVIRDDNGQQKAAFGLDFSPARARLTALKTMADAFKEKLDRQREVRRALSGLIQAINLHASQLSLERQNTLQQELANIIECETLTDQGRLAPLEALYEKYILDTANLSVEPEGMSPAGDIDVTTNYQTDNQHKECSQSLDASPGEAVLKSGEREIVEGKAVLRTLDVQSPSIPLSLISSALRETKNLLRCAITDWHSLVSTAPVMCRMISVSQAVWAKAVDKIGAIGASTLLSLVHEKACRGDAAIRNPSAYFLSLVANAESGSLQLQRSFYALRRT